MKVFLDHRLSGLERMKLDQTAILAIHWQVDVVEPQGAMGIFHEAVKRLGIVEKTAAVIAAGRKLGMPIVYVNVAYQPGYPELVRNNGLFNTVPKMGCLVRGTPGVLSDQVETQCTLSCLAMFRLLLTDWSQVS